MSECIAHLPRPSVQQAQQSATPVQLGQQRVIPTFRLVRDGRVQLRVLGVMIRRVAEIIVCFFPPISWLLLRQTPLLGERWFSRERLHELFVDALARAGPVGIKWGQWASTRYDLFEVE